MPPPDMALDEKLYKADMELLCRYQEYSSQIVRLSLGGIAVVGFFFTLFANDNQLIGANALGINVRLLIITSLLSLGLSAIAALGHHFTASDGLGDHIDYLRNFDVRAEKAASLKRDRNKKYKRSFYYLRFATGALIVGALLLVGAFSTMLLSG